MINEDNGSSETRSVLRSGPSRRSVLATGAAATALSGFPYISRARAAQTLKFWQFYAPGGGRKYLNQAERARALAEMAKLPRSQAVFALTLAWTGAKLKSYRIENLLAGHCTGIEAVYRLRQRIGLARSTAVVGAVGAGFDLDKGIQAGSIAH